MKEKAWLREKLETLELNESLLLSEKEPARVQVIQWESHRLRVR
jgi:hypothetical protein